MDEAIGRLLSEGFAVIPGPVAAADLPALAAAYDGVFALAGDEVRHSSTSSRLSGFVNRGPWFDPIYVHPPLLEAAAALIGRHFKLSAYHGRTVPPFAGHQSLHQDFKPLADGWPMLGFILMVDAFTAENGPTRFLPGSQHRTEPPQGVGDDLAEHVRAIGPAGSMVIYNGSVWHGHGANRTGSARRSIQGALIRADQASAVDHARETTAETRARVGAVARRLLGLG